MSNIFPKLFERGKIGRLEIDNRVIKAPTLVFLCNPDGSVTDILVRFYEEVARGGSGLVIVEGASVLKGPVGFPILSAAGTEFIPGLSLLAQTIYDNGAKSALQLVPGQRVPLQRYLHGLRGRTRKPHTGSRTPEVPVARYLKSLPLKISRRSSRPLVMLPSWHRMLGSTWWRFTGLMEPCRTNSFPPRETYGMISTAVLRAIE